MTFDDYQDIALQTAIYPENLAGIYPALGLAGETGEVCEKLKKIFRDKAGNITDTDRLEITKEIGDVLWYLASLSSDLGIRLDDAAEINYQKLASRKERGALSGSGDNR